MAPQGLSYAVRYRICFSGFHEIVEFSLQQGHHHLNDETMGKDTSIAGVVDRAKSIENSIRSDDLFNDLRNFQAIRCLRPWPRRLPYLLNINAMHKWYSFNFVPTYCVEDVWVSTHATTKLTRNSKIVVVPGSCCSKKPSQHETTSSIASRTVSQNLGSQQYQKRNNSLWASLTSMVTTAFKTDCTSRALTMSNLGFCTSGPLPYRGRGVFEFRVFLSRLLWLPYWVVLHLWTIL